MLTRPDDVYQDFEDADNQIGIETVVESAFVPSFTPTRPIPAHVYKKVMKLLADYNPSIAWNYIAALSVPKQLTWGTQNTSAQFIELVKSNLDELLPQMKVRGGFQPDFALGMHYDKDFVAETINKIKLSAKQYRSAVYFAISQSLKEAADTGVKLSYAIKATAELMMLAALNIDQEKVTNVSNEFLSSQNLYVGEFKSDFGVKVRTPQLPSFIACLDAMIAASSQIAGRQTVSVRVESVFVLVVDALPTVIPF